MFKIIDPSGSVTKLKVGVKIIFNPRNREVSIMTVIDLPIRFVEKDKDPSPTRVFDDIKDEEQFTRFVEALAGLDNLHISKIPSGGKVAYQIVHETSKNP